MVKCKNKDNKFPSKISAGGEETLYVGKRTGASVGPEGWVQYTTDLKEGGSSELTINFHKPYGSEATTCSANATKILMQMLQIKTFKLVMHTVM
ncbi:hypothetical protein P4S72_15455 [Vibrio sp. PP-XX7]